MSKAFHYAAMPKEQVSCPICDGEQFDTLCQTDRYLMGVQTVNCSGCGLVLTNPVPAPDALEEFYQTHYRQYYRKLDKPNLSYIARYALDRRAIHTTDYLARHELIGHGKRVLDVGCGEGSILREINARYADAPLLGVELSDKFRGYAQDYAGCPIYPHVEQLPPEYQQPVDLVIVSHVLEHVPDPVAFLEDLRDRLAPGGQLFIDVPDVCGYHWLADLHIAHILHFSLRTLVLLLERAGLQVVEFDWHHPPKLPGCIRVVAGRDVPPVELPDTARDEKQARERIARFGRGATLFSYGFRAIMSAYEMHWNLRHRLFKPVIHSQGRDLAAPIAATSS